MRSKLIASAAVLAVASLVLAGCSTGGGDESDQTLTLWHYEGADSAMGKAWDAAITKFEAETGATVKFEEKSFEQIRSTASQVLNSDAAPDLLEYNKGNATAGLLASQGLLLNLDDAVAQYGWDKKLAPSLQTTTKYDDKGVMGSGSVYGIPNYGEFVMMYYNQDLFDKYGIAIPTDLASFESALAAFKAEGITPLAESAAEYPLGQLFYQLALSKADRQFVNDYELYQNPVDWQGPELTYAAETIKSWVDKGYISKDSSGLKAEDAGVSFINGTSPMFYSGSWWYGRFQSEVKFNWTSGLYPDGTLAPGSSGNIWVIPANSKHADLAEKFIDITMSPEIQAIIGNNGGVPVAANPDDITDPKSQELIANFNTLTGRDGLAFYPDWPTSTFYDQLNAALQELVNGTKTPSEVLTQLGTQYDEGVAEITG
jgi:raffinose/stachyose/melibiose transport system substrate-binding protein